MQAAASILVSGNTTLDVITICNVPYNPSGKRPVTQYKQTPGGQAANLAHLLANLGNNVSFIGAIGNDAAAQIVVEDFRCAGIEVLHSAFCSAPHHIGFVRVDQNDGERFIDMYKDPQLTCDSLELDEGWVKGFDCIYIDSHEPALALRIGQLGQKLNIPVVADVEEVNENTSALLQYIDVLIAPGKIVTQLGHSADVEKAVQSTLARGFAAVVATLGAGGCLGVSREET